MDGSGATPIPQKSAVGVEDNGLNPLISTQAGGEGSLLSQVSNNPFFTAVSDLRKRSNSN